MHRHATLLNLQSQSSTGEFDIPTETYFKLTIDMMLDQRFENREKGRYYRLILSKDLFGDWVITRVWGGIGKANGRIIHISCPNYEEAIKLFTNIAKMRKQRGYQLCIERK